jgi:hypothetical protein
VRVLVCMNEDCHREIDPLRWVGAERKGPHPRSIDAANVSEAIYTRNADRLMLFWHLRERRVGRVLAGDNRIKLLFLATSSAGATRTTRTAKLRS